MVNYDRNPMRSMKVFALPFFSFHDYLLHRVINDTAGCALITSNKRAFMTVSDAAL